MRKTQKGKGIEFTFDNKFSKYRVSKDDRRIHNFVKLKYKLVKFFHLRKLFKNASWFRMMDYYWNDETQNNGIMAIDYKNIKLTNEDLKLEQLVIFDLLPKEYVADFRNKYIRIRNQLMKPVIINRRPKDIYNSFAQMETSKVLGYWYNLDNFLFNEKSNLFKYFDSFDIQIIGISESFYCVKYTLGINENVNKELAEILRALVYKKPQCSSCGKWWRRKSFAGCYYHGFFNSSKAFALQDFILELKGVFFKEIQKKLFNKFFNWHIIPPSAEVYSSNTLDSKSNEIFELLDLGGITEIDYSKEYNTYFKPDVRESFNEQLSNSVIIADRKQFEQKGDGSYKFKEIERRVFNFFAEYFILSGLERHIKDLIYKAQLKVNKKVASHKGFKSLLNLRIKTERKLYFYKRLYKEIQQSIKTNKLRERELKKYSEIFTNEVVKENPNFGIRYSLDYYYKNLLYEIDEKSKIMESIYKYLDESARMVENRFNYKTIKWTFFVSLAALVVTLFAIDDFKTVKELIKTIKNLFS